MKLPDFEGWGIFAKVVEFGSFAQAARELQLSPPTVSKAIARLEHSLGVSLISRNSRHISITPAGQHVLERANRIFLEGELAESEARGGRAQTSGLVRLTAPMTFGVRHLAHVLPRFMEDYPDIDLSVSFTDGFSDLVSEGYDLAIRIASLADSSLRARRICSIRRVLVATPDYLRRIGHPTHPRDLAEQKSFIYCNGPAPGMIKLIRQDGGESFTLCQSARMEADNAEGFLPALEAGLGFGLFPDFMISEAVRAGRLEVMLPDWGVEDIGLYLLTPATTLRPRRVSLLMEHLLKVFEHPSWQLQEGEVGYDGGGADQARV